MANSNPKNKTGDFDIPSSGECPTGSIGGQSTSGSSIGVTSNTDYPGTGFSGGSSGISGSSPGTNKLGTQVSELKVEAKEKAAELGEQAKQKLNEYTEVAKDKARVMLDEGKHQAADMIANYADQAIHKLGDFSTTIREKDVTYLVDQIEDFARRRPVLFIGGALALGLLCGRFLKSSRPSTSYQLNQYAGGMSESFYTSPSPMTDYQPSSTIGSRADNVGGEEF